MKNFIGSGVVLIGGAHLCFSFPHSILLKLSTYLFLKIYNLYIIITIVIDIVIVIVILTKK